MDDHAAFELALLHAMRWEVGANFTLDDDTFAGLIDTPARRKKVGYVNDPHDRGGETKYGVAKTANPDLDITALDWPTAADVYYRKYWRAGGCHLLPPQVACMHFDGCVNHGVARASRFLQEVLGVAVDGQVGRGTAAAAAERDPAEVIAALHARRARFYQAIVANDPSQARFMRGWMSRVDDSRDYTSDPANFPL
jgi:lysozyme family protein